MSEFNITRFNMTEWSDFVRGVADPDMADQMRDHLDAGSTRSRRTVEALRRVAAVGRADGESPVPPGAVRIAKAIGSTVRADAEPKVRRVPCMLVFDSLLEPAAAGARGAQESHRELTFEAQGYSIDLRLEHEPSFAGASYSGTPQAPRGLGAPSARQVVVGQLLKLGDKEPVARAPVFMFSGERLIGKAVTGRYGEFQVEGSPRGLPRKGADAGSAEESLCILAGEDYLEMPLVTEPGSASNSEENAL